MNARSQFRLVSLLIVLLVPFRLMAGFSVQGITPVLGDEATVVDVNVEDLDTGATTTLTLAGQTVTPTLVQSNLIRFVVPAAAASGLVEVENGGVKMQAVIPFTITRSLAGAFNPPAGVSLSPAWTCLGLTGTGSVSTVNGSFTCRVRKDGPTLVYLIRNEDDPVFLAQVVSDETMIIVDAASTAVAYPLLVPGLRTMSDAKSIIRKQTVEGSSALPALVALIESGSADGESPLNDPDFDNAVIALHSDAVADLPQASSALAVAAAPALPQGLRLIDLNSNADQGENRFEIAATGPARNRPFYSIKHEAGPNLAGLRLNPTDWMLEAYELDTFGIDNYNALVASVNSTSELAFASGRPVSRGSVPANLLTAKLDVLGMLAEAITDATMEAAGFDAGTPKPDPNELRLPSVPGVYVVQAYSGGLYHGLGDQSELLDANDPHSRWLRMLGINSFVVAVDAVSVLLPVLDDGAAQAEVLNGLLFDMEKILAASAGSGTLEENTAVLREMIKALSKALLSGVLGSADDIKFSRILKGVGKTVGKVFDITGKISAAGQAAERTSGLLSPFTLALERSVVVVGEPWGPAIERFAPLNGEAGKTIEIYGDHFGWVKENVTVSFCVFEGSVTSSTPTVTGSVEGMVESISANRLVVRVPDHADWEAGFDRAITNPKQVNLCMERDGFFVTSRALDPAEWTYNPPPQITGIEPQTLTGTEPFVLKGGVFDRTDWRHYQLYLDGSVLLHIHSISPTGIVSRLPYTVANGSHTIELRTGGVTSSVPISVMLPERGVAAASGTPQGTTLFVTSSADNTTPDNQITLREAFHISAGTLGRNLTDDEVDRLVYWSPGQPIGAGARDTLDMQLIPNGTTFTIGSALPSPGSGDHFDLDGIFITGSGDCALQLDAVTNATLREATIINFDGNGLCLSVANNNEISFITVTNVTGDGVQLTRSKYNRLTTMAALDCDGDGIRLMVNSDGNSLGSVTSAFNAGDGIDVASGAQTALSGSMQLLDNGGHGLHLQGTDTRFNYMVGDTYDQNQDMVGNMGAGVMIRDGAAYNVVQPEFVMSNQVGGIVLSGSGVMQNTIGDPTIIRGPKAAPLVAIYSNGGPGILLEDNVHDNHLYKLNIAGSAGDGVEVRGSGTDANRARTLFTGVELIGNTPNRISPNSGYSLHVHGGATDTLLWGREDNPVHRNALLHDLAGAVRFADPGTAGNKIDLTYIGNGYPITDYLDGWFSGRFSSQGIGTNAIVIANGASQSVIDRTLITDCPGTGITLSGAGTGYNRLTRTQVGLNSATTEPEVGIALLDGPLANQIGQPGTMIGTLFTTTPWPQAADVLVVHASDTAIHLRNCGGEVDEEDAPVNPNVIQSARFNSNHTGMKLEGDTWVNQIGGPRGGPVGFISASEVYMQEACSIFGATNGIVIDGVSIPSPGARNRFEYNSINCGLWAPPETSPSVSQGPVDGTGVLITGGSSLNVFGETAARPNFIYSCNVGIDLDGIVGATVRGNEVGDDWSLGAHVAGLVIRGGRENIIGEPGTGGNIFMRNAYTPPSTMDNGLLLSGTVGNRVRNNTIQGFGGIGITVDESQENMIGGPSRPESNTIADGGDVGIRVDGTTTLGNRFERNTITNNAGGGFFVANGAGGNVVGGARIVTGNRRSQLVYAPNTIEGNMGPGVEVATGLPLIDTPILYNSISANSAGIVLTAGGNNELPAPTGVIWTGGTVQGSVTSTTEVPVGSRVQVFSDPGAEGKALLGETEVKPDGSWVLPIPMPPPFAYVTATVTDPATLATSPFSVPALVIGGDLELERTGGGSPEDQDIATNVECGSVFALTGWATSETIRLDSLDFSYVGSLAFMGVNAFCAFEDLNQDAEVNDADRLVGTGVLTNDVIRFAFTNLFVSEDIPLNLLIALTDTDLPEGDTLQLIVTNMAAVAATRLVPEGLGVAASGHYPIVGDLFTVVAPSEGYATWRGLFWFGADLGNEEISGPDVDADGDGQTNLEEYLAGTDPTDPDSVLKVLSFGVSSTPGHFDLRFDAIPSRTYRVTGKVSADSDAGWTNVLTDITAADDAPFTVLFLDGGTSSGVFRIEIQSGAPAP